LGEEKKRVGRKFGISEVLRLYGGVKSGKYDVYNLMKGVYE
jgi:hypothetical protein